MRCLFAVVVLWCSGCTPILLCDEKDITSPWNHDEHIFGFTDPPVLRDVAEAFEQNIGCYITGDKHL